MEDGRLRYSVRTHNEKSGEHLTHTFTCRSDALRTLEGEWQISAKNDSGGAYRSFACRGRIVDDEERRRIELVFDDDMTIRPSSLPDGEPLVSAWSLVDALSGIVGKSDLRFALLDDMEKVTPGNRFVTLETWTAAGRGRSATEAAQAIAVRYIR